MVTVRTREARRIGMVLSHKVLQVQAQLMQIAYTLDLLGLDFDRDIIGRSKPARITIIARTTSNSINVNARVLWIKEIILNLRSDSSHHHLHNP
jgi:hypothetical protein